MFPNVMYFAYGANMSSERLRSHVCFARAIGRAKLLNKRMVCNKKGEDGSGKANLIESPGDVVWGVLYEVDSAELDKLDRAEGGYNRMSTQSMMEGDNPIDVDVYVSTKLTADPIPYNWYKDYSVEHVNTNCQRAIYNTWSNSHQSTDPKKERR